MNPLLEANGGIRPYDYRVIDTEYGVGLTRVAEATHCILGSLYGGYKYHSPEMHHIQEEMGIIKFCVDEYRKPMYTGRLFQGEAANATIQTIKELYPSLRKLAVQKRTSLKKHKKEIPLEIYSIALACYNLLEVLAIGAVKSVSGVRVSNVINYRTVTKETKRYCYDNLQNIQNAFNYRQIHDAVKTLDRAVQKASQTNTSYLQGRWY